MRLAVADSIFSDKNIDPETAHLIAPGCPGLAVSGVMVYSVPLVSKCGTRTYENATHMIYQNVLTGMYQTVFL